MNELALPEWRDDWALFLDVDGTILEIAATPDAVRVPVRAVAAIAAASERLAGAIALVSGRSLADLDELFAPLRLAAAGAHGAQRRTSTGRVLSRHESAKLEPARELLAHWAAAHPGIVLEDKRDSLALHYRNVPGVEPDARRIVKAAARELGPAFHVQEGKKVLEIKGIEVDKGTAIEAFMAEAPFAGRLPVFLGDDLTDEAGFAAVNRLGGHSIAIGVARGTSARWRLPSEAHVLCWLESQGSCAGAST